MFSFFKNLKKKNQEPDEEEIKDRCIILTTSHNKPICPKCSTILIKDIRTVSYFCPHCNYSRDAILNNDKEG